MKTTLLALAIFTTSITLISCGGAEGTKVEKAGEKVTAAVESKPVPKDLMFKLNETIKLSDYVITVTKVIDDVPAPDEYTAAEKGKKFVAIEVQYENRTEDKQLTFNPFDWKLIDADGYNYEMDQTVKEPALNDGTLNPGQKSKGWVTFQTSKAAKGFKTQFQPNWLSNENVEVKLD